MEPLISVQNLTKVFTTRQHAPGAKGLRGAVSSLFRPNVRTVRAIDGISFQVERGEMLAFIGPNGAGKSTTIKCITGILRASSGTISALGMDPFRERRRLASRIGAVFGQKSQLWFHLPAIDSLRLLGDIYGIDRSEARRRIAELIDIFEIGDYVGTPVRKLSLGERVRCEIAASLLHEPEILFLDEPTIGLDVIARRTVRDLVKRVNADRGTTVFLTSHDAGDIEKICRRVIVINHGRVVWDDTVNSMKYAFFRRKVIDLKLDAPLSLSSASFSSPSGACGGWCSRAGDRSPATPWRRPSGTSPSPRP